MNFKMQVDEDTQILFEDAIKCLQILYGYTEKEAIGYLEDFYYGAEKIRPEYFKDPLSFDIYYHHDGPKMLAYKVQFSIITAQYSLDNFNNWWRENKDPRFD